MFCVRMEPELIIVYNHKDFSIIIDHLQDECISIKMFDEFEKDINLHYVCYMCKATISDEMNVTCVLLVDGDATPVLDQLVRKGVKAERMCRARYELDADCPLIRKQSDRDEMVRADVSGHLEWLFGDEELMQHPELLAAMDHSGWLPLYALKRSLRRDAIMLDDETLQEAVRQSQTLMLHDSREFLRRQQHQLPTEPEMMWKLIVYYNFHHHVKRPINLSSKLENEGEVVEFDYPSRSSLVSLFTTAKVELSVSKLANCPDLSAFGIVPRVNEVATEPCPRPQLADELDLLYRLLWEKDDAYKLHQRRLRPSQLSYIWPTDFQAPGDCQLRALLDQVHFYFGDHNVLTDLHLLQLITEQRYRRGRPQCAVSVQHIAKFTMMQTLSGGNDPAAVAMVVWALCHSDQLEISEDGLWLRRRLPLPLWNNNIYTHSLFVTNLPLASDNWTYHDVEKVFSRGNFSFLVCRMILSRLKVPHFLERLCSKIPGLGGPDNIIPERQNVAMIQFEHREHLSMAAEFAHAVWPNCTPFVLGKNVEIPPPAKIVWNLAQPVPVPQEGPVAVIGLQSATNLDRRVQDARQRQRADRLQNRDGHQQKYAQSHSQSQQNPIQYNKQHKPIYGRNVDIVVQNSRPLMSLGQFGGENEVNQNKPQHRFDHKRYKQNKKPPTVNQAPPNFTEDDFPRVNETKTNKKSNQVEKLDSNFIDNVEQMKIKTKVSRQKRENQKTRFNKSKTSKNIQGPNENGTTKNKDTKESAENSPLSNKDTKESAENGTTKNKDTKESAENRTTENSDNIESPGQKNSGSNDQPPKKMVLADTTNCLSSESSGDSRQ